MAGEGRREVSLALGCGLRQTYEHMLYAVLPASLAALAAIAAAALRASDPDPPGAAG
jgi:hypothetical protein